MPIFPIKDFFSSLLPNHAIFGLDYGQKTIGIALSDPNLIVASPLQTIYRKKFSIDIKILIDLIQTYKIGGLIIGLPLHLDGNQGRKAQAVNDFAKNIMMVLDLPITLWDERFSTIAADKMMLESNLSRKKRDLLIDQIAAAYMLQGALNYFKNKIKNENG
ncbi:MAG: Holliday junction resolvase RuvX [Alphaproteobacteria bacterium]|nr:Holliday junction resolvase RuvX [Alphaproteobacteria bacterium]